MKGGRTLRVVVTTVVALLLVVALWEGYKWMGGQTDDHWPGTSIELPTSTDDLTMPHATDIVGELFEEVRDGRARLPLYLFLLKKGWYTFQEAAIGFSFGLAIGLGLAILMLRWRVAERGLLPWINVSQTVPLIALAPIIGPFVATAAVVGTLLVLMIIVGLVARSRFKRVTRAFKEPGA